MTIYSVTYDRHTVEFLSRENAESYAVSVGLIASDVVELERNIEQEISSNLPPITARQIRLQLVIEGVSLAQIDAALDQLPSPDKELAKIEWEYANEFDYNNPLIHQVAAMLGLNSESLQQFWQEAMSL
jgi:hypothetical protein